MKLNFKSTSLIYGGFLLICYLNIVHTSAISSYNTTSYPSENALIADLRKRVQNLGLSSFFKTNQQLARYIEDAGFQVQRAFSRIQRVAIWRRAAKADNLLKWKPSETLSTNLPYECTGVTADGNPVFYIPVGRWNFKEIQDAAQGPEVFTYLVRMLEEAQNSTIGRVNPKSGEPVDQAVFIVDARGYNLFRLLNLRATFNLLRAVRAADRFYPFIAKKWYFVRVPLSFRILWTLTRTFFLRSRRFSGSVAQVYSSVGHQGIRALKHNIPLSSIPVQLGGTALLRQISAL